MEFGEDDSDEDYDSEGEIDSQDGSINGSNGKIWQLGRDRQPVW